MCLVGGGARVALAQRRGGNGVARAPGSFISQPVQFYGSPLAPTRKKGPKFPAARALELFYGLQRRQPNCFPLRFYGLRLKSAHRNSAFKFIYFGRKNGCDGLNWEP